MEGLSDMQCSAGPGYDCLNRLSWTTHSHTEIGIDR